MKISKHIAILLSCLLLGSNIGLAFNVHYCMGKVSGVSVSYKSEDRCAVPEPADDMGVCCATASQSHKNCCKDSVVKLKDKTDKVVLVNPHHIDLAAFCTFTVLKSVYVTGPARLVKKQNPSYYCEAHAPPLFKLYCRYTLYA